MKHKKNNSSKTIHKVWCKCETELLMEKEITRHWNKCTCIKCCRVALYSRKTAINYIIEDQLLKLLGRLKEEL